MDHLNPTSPQRRTSRWRKALGSLAVGALLALPAMAQTVQVGTGTSTGYYSPYNSLYNYSYVQNLYLGSEFTAAGYAGGAGTITKIRFDLATTPGTPANSNNWTIYLGNTTETALVQGAANYTPTSEMVQVFSGIVSDLGTTGWKEITLTPPFEYTGGNLIVAVDENSPGYSTSYFRYTSTTPAYMVRYLYSDSFNPDPAALPGTYSGSSSQTYNRANMQVHFMEAPCAGVPAPGNTTGPASTCSTIPFTLGITNVPAGSGISYQWYADDGSGSVPVGTDSPNLTTSQTAATDYYCEVTCSTGPSTGSSSTLSVGMNAPMECYCTPTGAANNGDEIRNFTLSTLNNNSAAEEGTAGYMDYTGTVAAAQLTEGLSYTASLTSGTGSGSHGAAIWIDYGDNGIFEPSERVADLPSSISGSSTVTFPSFTAGAVGVHRLRVQYTWNQAGVGLDPCSISTTYSETEDYLVEIVAGTTCSTPVPGATTGPASVCGGEDFTLGITNEATELGISYQWYADDGSGPLAVGTNASTYTTSQTVATQYYCEVTCSTGPSMGSSDVLQVDMEDPIICNLCTPTVGTTDVEPICSVSFGSMSNSTCTAVNCDNGYEDYTGTVTPPVVFQNLSYDLEVTGNTNGSWTSQFTAFFDWDQDGTFEDVQPMGSINNDACATTVTLSVTIPDGNTGLTRMRIIKNFSSVPMDPCGTYSYGQAEDYYIDVQPAVCTPATASAVITPDCVLEQFSVNVDLTSLGDATDVDIVADLNGGGDVVMYDDVTALTNYAMGPYNLGDVVNIRVLHNGNALCDLDLGNFTIAVGSCPPLNDDCANAIALTVNPDLNCGSTTSGTVENATASSDNNPCGGTADDDVWYSFVATSTAHSISLINTAGSTSDLFHGVYSGSCGALLNLSCSDPNESTVGGLTIGETYLLRVYTWTATSGQTSTFDVCIGTPPPPPANDDCGGAFALTVNPDYNCGAVTSGTLAFATGSPDANSCSGNTNDDVWFSFVATSTSHRVSLLNVTPYTDMYHAVYSGSCGALVNENCSDSDESTVTGLTIGDTYLVRVYSYFGPYAPTFDICIGTPPAPPANDECADAIALTVNPDFGCGTVTAGTIASATASADANSCGGTANDDVWYTFVATSTTHRVSLTNITGGTTDLYMRITSGACGAMTNVLCSDAETANLTGLTIGTTYTVRVYSYTSTAGQTSSFNICVGTPPPPPANDDCGGAFALTVNPDYSCGSVTAGTITSATASTEDPSACFGTENDDVWFSFVATSTSHQVELLNVTGTTTDLYHSLWTGGCGSLALVPGTCSDPNNSTPSGLTIGETYFLRVYSYYANAESTTFDVCIGTAPPIPANDECAGAYSVTVNPDYSCGSVTAGTIASATASAVNTSACSGTENDDVWFSFVATSTTHRIDLINVTGSTNDLYHSLWEGGCGSLTLVPGTCSDPNTSNPSGLTIGETYFLRVYSWGSSAQTTSFDVCIGTTPPPPANDLCADAILVGANSVTPGYTSIGTNTGAPGTCTTPLNTAPGVWYMVEGINGMMTADLCGASFDTKIGIFTGSCGNLTCLQGNDDDNGVNGAGICGGGTQSSTSWMGLVGTTYYIYVTAYSTQNGAFNLTLSSVPGTSVVVAIQTDASPSEISWEITNGATVVATGGPSVINGLDEQTVMLSSTPTVGCYGFKLMDSFGDGIINGGWELRTTDGKLLLKDDFAGGSVSPATPSANPNYGTSHSFCLPKGPANIAPTECGIFNNLLGNKVYANKVIGASNYQFEFSDPDAGFMRRIARPYNYVHFWDMVTNPLVPGVKYFARVRTDRDGPMLDAHFGRGCEMGIGMAVISCTQLIKSPAYGHSCNETRTFNTSNSFIYAKPVQGATQYTFRIFNTQEGYDQTFTRNTYILQLKWYDVAPLIDGYTYAVEVSATVNGVEGPFCTSECNITIVPSGNRPEASMVQANGTTSMWPNPVRDGQVNLNIDGLVDAEQNITIDIQDIYGKQVFAKEFGNSGERFNTILNLSSDIASGVYMVNITVNGERTVQRLSIIR